MKNRIVQKFQRLLFLFLIAWVSVAGASSNPAATTHQPADCNAPTPGWLVATAIGPTSITLAWEAGQLITYYKLDAYDLTGGFALATQFTTNPTYVWQNLTPAHTYLFEVRASRCEEGPYSPSISLQETTSTIIIDVVTELSSPCTPGGPAMPTGQNAAYSFCVQKNTAPNAPPYNNGFVGEIEYQQDKLRFALASQNQFVHFGALNTENDDYFFFPSDTTNPWVMCYHKNNPTPLFRINVVNYVPNPFSGTSRSYMNIVFFQDIGDFKYCPATNLPCAPGGAMRGGGGRDVMLTPEPVSLEETGFRDAIPTALLQAGVLPNPFREEAIFLFEAQESAPLHIELIDALGRQLKVLAHEEQALPGQRQLQIPGQGLPAGVYYLRAQIGQDTKVFRLLKQE